MWQNCPFALFGPNWAICHIVVELDEFVSENFTAKIREKSGTNASRQLRQTGRTPAILYGMNKEAVSISIPASAVDSAIRHGSHLIELQGDLNEPALIKAVQWDAFGIQVKHLDLQRVDLSQDLEVTIGIVLHGVSPGVTQGGVLNHSIHELEISCPATRLPEHLELNINRLEIDGELYAKDVELPEGASLMSDPDAVVVSCAVPTVQPEEEISEDGGADEPEVIGEKDAGDESEDSDS